MLLRLMSINRMKKYIYTFIILFLVFSLLISCDPALMRFVTTRGNPAKNLHLLDSQIFPYGFDVSSDNKIYFCYSSERGTAIYSMEMETGALKQITEDGNFDLKPVVSIKGQKILFERSGGKGKHDDLFLVNSDGTDCKMVFKANTGIFIAEKMFSKDEKTIYFIGNAGYSKTCDTVKFIKSCFDIFSVDVDGTNFKRITKECCSNIFSLALTDEGNHILATYSHDKLDPHYDPDVYKITKNGKLFLVSCLNGDIKRFDFDVDPQTKLKKFPIWSLVPFVIDFKNKYLITGQGNYGFWKLDLEKHLLTTLIDSINGMEYIKVADEIGLYNIARINDDSTIIAGQGRSGNYHFVKFDLKTKTIIQSYSVDTNKFIPQPGSSVMRQYILK